MLIVMHPRCTPEAVAAVEARVRSLGFTPHAIAGEGRTAIGVTGNVGPIEPGPFLAMAGVADAVRVTQPFKLVNRHAVQWGLLNGFISFYTHRIKQIRLPARFCLVDYTVTASEHIRATLIICLSFSFLIRASSSRVGLLLIECG